MRKISRIEPRIPTVPQKIKVAAYARVSRESERMEHSISAQISYYSDLIQKNPEWEYAGVYADYGISGTGIAKRTEFKRLIEDCETGKIQIVLVKSISRFARNTVDLLNTVRHLKDLGIEVRFERENISSMSSDGELMLSILASFSEEESKSTSNNIKWAIRKKFQQGKTWHSAAFGYRWNGETFIIDEEEAKAVRVIFENFIKGISMTETSKWLKENGYRVNSKSFVHHALKNEVYVGDVRLQKYFTVDVLSHKFIKNEGQLPQYYIKNNHQPIIDRETFDKVQAMIKESYEFNPIAHKMVKPSCFSEKIKCGKCGQNYIKAMTKTNSIDGLAESWVCAGKHKWHKSFCDAKGIVGSRLRSCCCEVLGIEDFDEILFSKQIEKIVTTDTDILEFYFYDGTMKTSRIHYFSKDEKKYTDPHSRFFGYRWSKNGYQIVNNEAEAVKLMYKYYADGWSIGAISKQLEEMGYKTVRGKLSRSTIARILDSELYIGNRFLRGQFTADGKDLLIENDHEIIIDIDLNEKV
jgi:DNA invertase Pin-like site-specific DNA recombinase